MAGDAAAAAAAAPAKPDSLASLLSLLASVYAVHPGAWLKRWGRVCWQCGRELPRHHLALCPLCTALSLLLLLQTCSWTTGCGTRRLASSWKQVQEAVAGGRCCCLHGTPDAAAVRVHACCCSPRHAPLSPPSPTPCSRLLGGHHRLALHLPRVPSRPGGAGGGREGRSLHVPAGELRERRLSSCVVV